ncbi:hypothetical protein B0H66DRAFT_64994 [Apodospora peruviana]|uniref:Secreted protein n=1 Tax=Apodospora peruviana TaxID=516989 RepID=A0AAE0ISJ4_9PEZI|nr:hypothetical protein B0H66DRAFT_64994 [Apodospora peruviana]
MQPKRLRWTCRILGWLQSFQGGSAASCNSATCFPGCNVISLASLGLAQMPMEAKPVFHPTIGRFSFGKTVSEKSDSPLGSSRAPGAARPQDGWPGKAGRGTVEDTREAVEQDSACNQSWFVIDTSHSSPQLPIGVNRIFTGTYERIWTMRSARRSSLQTPTPRRTIISRSGMFPSFESISGHVCLMLFVRQPNCLSPFRRRPNTLTVRP